MPRKNQILILICLGGILAGLTVTLADRWGGVGNGASPWLLGLLVFCLYEGVVFFVLRRRIVEETSIPQIPMTLCPKCGNERTETTLSGIVMIIQSKRKGSFFGKNQSVIRALACPNCGYLILYPHVKTENHQVVDKTELFERICCLLSKDCGWSLIP